MTANVCPQCRSDIPVDAPAGLCPRCLLSSAAEAQTVPPLRLSDEQPEAVGMLFPQLEVQEMLGRGGMGLVYRARQTHLDRVVALKLLPRAAGEDPAFAERFGREARLLARLTHPGIITVHDSGCVQGQYFLVMEYADGGNLREAVRAGKMEAALVTGDWRPAGDNGRLHPMVAAHILAQLCDALQYAHDQGIVHRDLKPENILLTRAGGVKVADFGLAKLLDPVGPDPALTGTGQVLGTFRYMAPEQLTSPHQVDHRADLYALGVVFYELLTGDQPSGSFPPPSRFVPAYPGFDAVIRRALASDPAQRYQHASEFRAAVEAVIASSPGVAAANSFAGGEFRLSQVADVGLRRFYGLGLGGRFGRLFAGTDAASAVPERRRRWFDVLTAPENWAIVCCVVLILVLFAPWTSLDPIGDVVRAVRVGYVTIKVYLITWSLNGYDVPQGVLACVVGSILLFLILLTKGLRWSGLLQGMPALIGGLTVTIACLVHISDTRQASDRIGWPPGFVQLKQPQDIPATAQPINMYTLRNEAQRQYRESVSYRVGEGGYLALAAGAGLILLSIPLLRQTWTRPRRV